ncbi:hypothetical protein SFC12_04365 [Lactococcus lactis]|uniref:hypothetical protein n=1 Tax=Lactococcus lactis TaxID=1358 RepID=UPI00398280CE
MSINYLKISLEENIPHWIIVEKNRYVIGEEICFKNGVYCSKKKITHIFSDQEINNCLRGSEWKKRDLKGFTPLCAYNIIKKKFNQYYMPVGYVIIFLE